MIRLSIIFALILAGNSTGSAEDKVSFQREVQPILAKVCYACHGPDESSREADLLLNDRKVAVSSGAIVPGNPAKSELVRRIESQDEYEQMPPPESSESLTAEQKQILKQWIREGADYEPHWAFQPPQKSPLPKVQNANWPLSPIDVFTLHRMEKHNLSPSPKADRYTLARRLSLDLIGLPPTPQEADQFVNDPSPKAYEYFVDRLLDSPQYGERWARLWLDLARYSDTNGYEKDRPRSIWPYRDWVIKALNDDMPYDKFTVKQLAGDLLPTAMQDDVIATGFHRNTMMNEEGGIDPLEYRYYALVDRVATTGTVWLGLTTGCAQCHSHKYDPISHTDYYALMALFNNADEPDLDVKSPELEQRRHKLHQKIEQLTANLKSQFLPDEGPGTLEEQRQRNYQKHFQKWLNQAATEASNWNVWRPVSLDSNLPKLTVLEDGSILSTGDITKRDEFHLQFDLKAAKDPITALRLEVLPDDRLPAHGPGRAFYEGRKGDFFLSEFTTEIDQKPIPIQSASQSYGKISIGSGNAKAENVIDGKGSTGWSTAGREGEAHQLVLNFAKPLPREGMLHVTMLFERHFAASLGRFRISWTTKTQSTPKANTWPVSVEAILAKEQTAWSQDERVALENYFVSIAPQLNDARKPIQQLRRQIPTFPTTLVFQERPADNRRVMHRHHRGEYLSAREEVTAGVPKLFPPLPDDQPANRLTFARWLVSDRNPLVARVAVNRAWRAFFGQGLIQTNGDFGTQSDPPTHPELLDWLAVEFVEQGWSLKKLHRMIVMTATYRQSSDVTPETLRQDPANRWLSRGSRFSVDAEIVRDTMLKASGKLSKKLGGPSVYPPQPANVTALAYGNFRWNTSTGEDRYRRSLYTFSKRTAPFAAFATFNAPTGESCVAKRDRSVNPLQSLTLLNDEMFLELSRAIAKAAMTEKSEPAIATNIFRRLLTRPPTSDELAAMQEFYQQQKQRLASGQLDAKTITKSSQTSSEWAAWTMVARVIMNLNETVTRS